MEINGLFFEVFGVFLFELLNREMMREIGRKLGIDVGGVGVDSMSRKGNSRDGEMDEDIIIFTTCRNTHTESTKLLRMSC